MSSSLVQERDEGPVRVLTIDRPQARNALSRALVQELDDALGRANAALGVRAVALTATGPTFCAGMDLKEATSGGEDRAVADVQGLADLFDRLHDLSKPVLAAVVGDAFGGGAGLVMACDYAAIAPSARLGFPEVRRGLVASMVLHDLVRHVGDRRARQLLLTGEPIGAELALNWGLVNAVEASVLDHVLAVARRMAEGGPHALEMTKRLLDEATGRPKDLRGAGAVTALVRTSDEGTEGMAAFLEKRPPRWSVGEDHP